MEETIQSYIFNYDMNITTLRFFNVFGPRQDIHRKSPPLINYIVRQIKQKKLDYQLKLKRVKKKLNLQSMKMEFSY